MANVNISVPSDLMKIVDDKVASGLYSDASEVVSDGIRLLVELDLLKTKQKEALNFEIDKGLDSLKSGKYFNGNDVYSELLARRQNYQQ